MTQTTRTIKRYKNRKLYDTESSKYITLTQLLALPTGSFRVVENVGGTDITDTTILSALFSHFQDNPAEFNTTVRDALLVKAAVTQTQN